MLFGCIVFIRLKKKTFHFITQINAISYQSYSNGGRGYSSFNTRTQDKLTQRMLYKPYLFIVALFNNQFVDLFVYMYAHVYLM